MKKTWLLVLFAICFQAQGQKQKIEVYATAGLNNTLSHLSEGSESHRTAVSQWSWQAGGAMFIPLQKNLFIYTGLQFEKKRSDAKGTFATYIFRNFNYILNYISLPIELGKQWSLASLKFRLSAGGFIATALSGRLEGKAYGNTGMFDRIKNNYWGMQANIAIVSKRWMLQGQYQWGLSKINHDDSYVLKYNTGSVNVGYRLNR